MLRLRYLLGLSLCAALAAPVPAFADASIGLHLGLPLFLLHTPAPRVVVAPGVWLIEDDDTPLYYADGLYWSLHGHAWYRARHPGGSWVHVGPMYVPPGVRRHVVVRHGAPYVQRTRTVIHPGGPVIVYPRQAPPGHLKQLYKHKQRGHRDRVVVF
jgi:hypothetical protein